MPDGTGLNKFQKLHPERFFDVGIAEQHAVTFAAGLAAEGFKPVCAIYSTFLQRAYDPIIHDVALQHLPVRFFLDRAGLVGDDGGTHHGVFDLAYLRCVPNMVVMAPKDTDEMRAMTRFALAYEAGPIAVRYPRGGSPSAPRMRAGGEPSNWAGPRSCAHGGDVALIALGAGVEIALHAAEHLAAGGHRGHRGQRPLLQAAGRGRDPGRRPPLRPCRHGRRRRRAGRLRLRRAGTAGRHGVTVPVALVGLPDHFVEHGPVPVLREVVGLTAEAVAARARDLIGPVRRPTTNGKPVNGHAAQPAPVGSDPHAPEGSPCPAAAGPVRGHLGRGAA